jgi:NAD(P)-dependent dehydrogenase (short-subunit alcohol dehydrogenase family)
LEPFDQIFSLSGKTALVAGASRGIGLSIAQALATAGAHTILAARSLDKLREQTVVIHSAGHAATTLELDVTNSDSIRAAAASLEAVDILVNVSGTNLRKPFEKYSRA